VARLADRERGNELAASDRRQPAALLLVAAELRDRTRGYGVRYERRRKERPPHLLGDDDDVLPLEAEAVVVFGNDERRPAERGRFLPQRGVVRRIRRHQGAHALERTLRIEKPAYLRLELLLFGSESEI